MIFSRRWASATGPAAQAPLPSGPRDARVAAIASTAPTSALRPRATSPAKPHTAQDAFAVRRPEPAPAQAAANAR